MGGLGDQVDGLPHHHTFDEWWTATRTEPLDSGSVAQQTARQAWDDAQAQTRRLQDLMLADLADLLRAVGMFDGAQPKTPHNLMQEAISRVPRPVTATLRLYGGTTETVPVPAGGSTERAFTCPSCDTAHLLMIGPS